MLKSIIRPLLPDRLAKFIQRARFGRFTVLQWDTEGLLSPDIYEAICSTFRGSIDGDVIEVGGAGGSASVAICWGLKEGMNNGNLIVVEKCEGGTRTAYGDYQSNLERYWRTVETHGVKPQIRLFPEYLTMDNGTEVLEMVSSGQIGGLMLDADGHIHRDFALFWERLATDAPIIVDDYHENLSPKHALTFALLNQFIEWGLITRQRLIGETFFGRKGPDTSFGSFDWEKCEQIVSTVCRDSGVIFDKSGITAIQE